MTFSRTIAAAALIAVPAALHAETVTIYRAADPAALALGKFQTPVAGARAMELTIGIGSALFRDPKSPPNVYYTASDRGPNYLCTDMEGLLGIKADAICPAVEGQAVGAGRLYALPTYNVSIYQVTLDPAAKTYRITQTIPLKTPKGNPVLGLTNPLTKAITDKPRDGAGKALKADVNAIDAEGLVRLADGRFFIAEENATGIVEISPEGVILRRWVPAGVEGDFAGADYPIVPGLPAILSMRTSNRGLESLSKSEDDRFLYTLVQNPLTNPDAATYNNSLNARLLKLEIGSAAGATTLTPVAEYVYQLDDWNNFAKAGATDAVRASSLRISEMTALGKEHFLVDERTDQVAKLFEIDLAGATNILGSKWDDPKNAPTLEASNDLTKIAVVPVKKTERLVASSLESAKTVYPAKIEGLSLTSDGKLILLNDNDFGIAGDSTRIYIVEGTEIGPR